ncbi:MAG TPA: DUF1622 domain-containing protein [Geobacteraceae bacterium]|nr:DUF1622 domain-containing protein [Geobacteraceae bacterium]
MENVEYVITNIVVWLKLSLHLVSVILVGIGAAVSVFLLTRILATPDWTGFHRLRRTFARYLVLALEFQLAADIVATAVEPDWGQLGRLGAIAAIRTFLNYFLQLEMKDETAEGNSGAS